MVEDTKVEPPQGYTIRGEACRDKCDYYGYTYTWCHKVTPSNLGNWRGSDYCSNEPSMYICSWFSILFLLSNLYMTLWFLWFFKIVCYIFYSCTGKSLSEALIFASTNPQCDDRLFIELQVQYMKIPSSNLERTCCVQKFFLAFRTIFVHNMFWTCNFLVLNS